MSSNQAQTLVFVEFIYVIGCLDTNKLFSNVAVHSSVLFIILRQMFADDWINCASDNIFR